VNGSDHSAAIFYLMAAILPISALMARRVPWRRVVLLVLIWTVIIGTAALIATIGHNGFADRWDRMKAMVSNDDQQVAGGTIRIRMADDGHFWASARINGVERRMLIDSGATTTALSVGTARAAGITGTESAFPTMLDTANGSVMAKVAIADTLALGPIVARQLHVVVAPEFGNVDVIGMNFLSRLGGWRVEGKTLVLSAPAPDPA